MAWNITVNTGNRIREPALFIRYPKQASEITQLLKEMKPTEKWPAQGHPASKSSAFLQLSTAAWDEEPREHGLFPSSANDLWSPGFPTEL